jgi:hypothetical protein
VRAICESDLYVCTWIMVPSPISIYRAGRRTILYRGLSVDPPSALPPPACRRTEHARPASHEAGFNLNARTLFQLHEDNRVGDPARLLCAVSTWPVTERHREGCAPDPSNAQCRSWSRKLCSQRLTDQIDRYQARSPQVAPDQGVGAFDASGDPDDFIPRRRHEADGGARP